MQMLCLLQEQQLWELSARRDALAAQSIFPFAGGVRSPFGVPCKHSLAAEEYKAGERLVRR